MLYVIGLQNCDKTWSASKWLEEQGFKYEFIDINKEPLTESELKELIHKVGLDVLLNKRSRTWRELGLSDKNPDEEELTNIMKNHQKLIQRPVLIDDEAVIVGFDVDAWSSFLQEEA